MITLIRGLPGSGKSTTARKMVESGRADAHFEADPYFDMDPDANVIECTGDYGSIHDVPEAQLRKMRVRWEPYVTKE